MNLLYFLLFSGQTIELDGEKSGFSFTIILILIIIVLIAVLLIRDKKLRGKVKGFFTLIGRKIKNARIRSGIEKEEKRLSDLIADLGSRGFEKNFSPDNSEDIIDRIKKEREIVEKFESALNDTGKKIEKLKSEHEVHISFKKSEIEKEKKIKDPIEKRFKELRKMIAGIKNESDDNEKKIISTGKGIEKTQTEIERLKKDELLDPEERQERKEKKEKLLAELEKELSDRTIREASIPDELSVLEKEAADLELKLDVFEKSISKLENEYKDIEQQYNDKISGLVKEKGHFTAQKAKSNNDLRKIYKDLGELLNKERPENNDLSVIYIDIDRANEKIRDLRSRLT